MTRDRPSRATLSHQYTVAETVADWNTPGNGVMLTSGGVTSWAAPPRVTAPNNTTATATGDTTAFTRVATRRRGGTGTSKRGVGGEPQRVASDPRHGGCHGAFVRGTPHGAATWAASA